jgi:uncharacterized damage-inducible protein DinB
MNVAELSDVVGTEKRALDAIIRRLSTADYRQPIIQLKPDEEAEGRRLDANEQFRQPVSGTWTVKDVLGHIAAYSDAERRALAAGVGRKREEPVYFDQFLAWNEEQYEVRRKRTPRQIVAELQENTARFLSLVKSLHEEDLIKTIRYPWNEQGTVHAFVLDALRHHREHREELERVLG